MNYNQLVLTPKYHNWTVGAVECYKRGGVCNGCETFELIGNQCKMKAAVISLVKNSGVPPENFAPRKEYLTGEESFKTSKEQIIKESNSNKKDKKELDMIKINTEGRQIYDNDIDLAYGKSFAPIIEAIKKGIITNKEIALASDIDAKLISVKYRDFYRTLTSKNLTTDLCGNTYLEKIIDFVQKRLKKSENKPYIPAPNDVVGEAFTAKEQEIVNLLLEGLNFKEICKKLVITMATFKTHLNNIYQKRDYHSIQDLILAENKDKPVIKIEADTYRLKQLEEENQKLKTRIQELENQPKPYIDFDEIKLKIQTEIDMLTAKLKAIELLEEELKTNPLITYEQPIV